MQNPAELRRQLNHLKQAWRQALEAAMDQEEPKILALLQSLPEGQRLTVNLQLEAHPEATVKTS